MEDDINPGGYKGSSKQLCVKCLEPKNDQYMDIYEKPVGRKTYYRCPQCGFTIWDPASDI